MVHWYAYPHKQPFYRRRRFFMSCASILLLCIILLFAPQQFADNNAGKNTPDTGPDPAIIKDEAFLFGIGTELDHDLKHRITKDAPVKMMTSWYNTPKDLEFMRKWQGSTVPIAYGSGYTLHLIIYNDDPEGPVNTKYGRACGRPYPVSERFAKDMEELAKIFRGGRLYVSMFTEFQTYPCEDNNWIGSENYYKALKDQYRETMGTFRLLAPGSQVSISWGGWQANWNDVGRQGGTSLIPHFADIMNQSDFQSFQAMDTVDNLYIIQNMTRALKPYRGKTMVSHYKPDNRSQQTFEGDMQRIFTPANMAQFKRDELFAFSFMDTENMNHSAQSYDTVQKIIKKYAK